MTSVLLDTCAVIVMMGGDMQHSAREAVIEAGLSEGIFVSPVTAWEVGLLARRRRRGRVEFRPDAAAWMARVLSSAGVCQAPFNFDIALASSALPDPFHEDPADRMLVATARYLGMPIVTSDRRILAYAQAGHVAAVVC
jgi:PIN domain nuclease of toxin-antitoxin system